MIERGGETDWLSGVEPLGWSQTQSCLAGRTYGSSPTQDSKIEYGVKDKDKDSKYDKRDLY